ncbi:MAG: hypothetical protein ABI604_13545, partial [Nitrospirota bacterium]
MTDFLETALLAPLEQLGRQVLSVLPNMLAMAIIIGIGFVMAWGVGHTVERILRVVRLDHLCNRLGINAALARGGVKSDPSHLVGRAAYWIIV